MKDYKFICNLANDCKISCYHKKPHFHLSTKKGDYLGLGYGICRHTKLEVKCIPLDLRYYMEEILKKDKK